MWVHLKIKKSWFKRVSFISSIWLKGKQDVNKKITKDVYYLNVVTIWNALFIQYFADVTEMAVTQVRN